MVVLEPLSPIYQTVFAYSPILLFHFPFRDFPYRSPHCIPFFDSIFFNPVLHSLGGAGILGWCRMQKMLLWSGRLCVRMEGRVGVCDIDGVLLWGFEVVHFSSHSQESFELIWSRCKVLQSLSQRFEYLRPILRSFTNWVWAIWVWIVPHLASVLTCKKKGIELA